MTLKRGGKQLVLIGDSKQLGPIYRVDVQENADSMLTRLVNAKYPHKLMLNEQFRMNKALLGITNKLIYNNQIINAYDPSKFPVFLNTQTPLLFLNVDD